MPSEPTGDKAGKLAILDGVTRPVDVIGEGVEDNGPPRPRLIAGTTTTRQI